MNRRLLLLLGCLLATLVLLGPPAAAQQARVRVNIGFEHDAMTLTSDGKANMPVGVTFVLENFTCTGPDASPVSAEISINNFPKPYGASMEPKNVKVLVPAGKPGPPPSSMSLRVTPDPILNLKWDVDGIPKRNASFVYVLEAQKVTVGGSCVTSPTTDPQPKSPGMNATIPDQADARRPGAIPTCSDAFEVGCIQPEASGKADGNSPGFDAAILAVGLVGVVGAFRRRR